MSGKPDKTPLDAPACSSPGGSDGESAHERETRSFLPHPGGSLGREVAPADAGEVQVPGYEILGVLGRGGMGVVYRARQLSLGRVVALKMILAGEHAGPGEVQRFLAEAEAVATFSHPGIVQVYEVGQHRGLPYMALELVGGGSLADRLRQGPLPPRETARLVEQLARAMNAAHQAGIVHRDLKPANVLLSERNEPKVTDFGLARRVEGQSDLTQTGAIVGTPTYMAPEQAGGQGKRVGPAADVYALGAVLYACLTGRPPFHAGTPLDTVLQVIREEPPPPRLLDARIPRDLETVCLKCLRKDPLHRYASAEGLAEDLRRWQAGEPILARPVGRGERAWKWVRRHPVESGLVSLVLLVILGSLGLVSWQWREAVAARLREVEQRELAEEAREDEARQRELAEAAGEKEREQRRRSETQLYRNRVLLAQRDLQASDVAGARDQLEQCPGELRGWEWYYLRRRCGIREQTWEGGRALAFSPDGRLLATVEGGGTARTVTVTVRDRGGRQVHAFGSRVPVRQLVFSSDSKHLAMLEGFGVDRRSVLGVRVIRLLDGRSIHYQTYLDRVVGMLAFGRDPHLLAVGMLAGRDLSRTTSSRVEIWDLATGKEKWAYTCESMHIRGLGVGPDGKWLAIVGEARDGPPGIVGKPQAYLLDATGGEKIRWLLPHLADQGQLWMAGLSDDGQRLAMYRPSLEGTRVWVMDTATGRQLVSLSVPGMSLVALSKDGQRLVAGSRAKLGKNREELRPGEVRAYSASGAAELARYPLQEGSVGEVAISPDGERVAAGVGIGGGTSFRSQLKVWGAPVGQAALVFETRRGLPGGSGAAPLVALDREGRLLAAAVAGEVVLWGAPGGSEKAATHVLEGKVRALAVGPDGLLAFATADGTLKLWDTTAADEMRVLKGHAGAVRALAFHPGRPLLASAGEDRLIRMWDVATGEVLHTLQGHPGPVCCLAFREDGKVLASGGEDGGVGLWDIETGEPLRLLAGQGNPVRSLAFRQGGSQVVAAGGEGKVGVWAWDAEDGRQVRAQPDLVSAVDAVLSRDGRRLFTTGADRTVRVWDVENGEQVLALQGHTDAAACLALSGNGGVLAAGCRDATLCVWDATSDAARNEGSDTH